ncbi:MAG: tRNA lysidine(34) synthetase TilS [Rikenellaceae bacterium]
MANLSKNFLEYIEQNSLIKPDDKILLTVSGGVDSMVLLDLFAATEYPIGVAHCNFKLRGEESEEDEVLVEEQAKKYRVPCYNISFDTLGEMERTGESMEMAARRLRYAWFNELCEEHGYTTIAVAHHADDSIETFFINLFRGTGLRGLTGIKKQLGKVIRPLSFSTRKEILEYASNNRIPYREDSSNRSTKYLRNKIRLGLVPRLREINPRFTQMMRGNLERLADAQTFINGCIEHIAKMVIEEQDGIYTLHVDRIDDNMPHGFVIYELMNTNFGFKGDVIDSIVVALRDENSSGKRFYSKDFVAYIDRGRILVTRIESCDICQIDVAQGAERAYCGNSVLYIENIIIDLIESFDLGDNVALLDSDKLQFPLLLRRWSEGDSFVPLGMEGHKKVSDFLIDEKVSQPEKERQFVLMSGEDIVWLVGRRIDDRYKLESESENVLKVTKEII